ncbi:MAG: hypothetical protein GY801_33600 [bacterium]|nr:hypothetical protein [bacterium]
MNAEGRALCNLFLCVFLGLAGCAGPLDTATEQTLVDDFTRDVYQTKAYLGSEHYLEYTNNSVAGRSPTGLFIDRSLTPWYETDATFWGAGTSGHSRALRSLQMLDRDLNVDHYAQGIGAGQLVRIREFSDKSDRLIVSFETLGRYDAGKNYGSGSVGYTAPRAGRIHFLLGEDGMKPFDRAIFEQMFEQLLVKVFPPATEGQRNEFISANFPQTPLADLSRFTGLNREAILKVYYASVLEQRELSVELQEQFTATLATASEQWPHILGIRLKEFESGSNFLELRCGIQEISNSLVYHSPELRAGLLFFDGAIPLLKDIKSPLLAQEMPQTFEHVTMSFSYPYFDRAGRRSDEVQSFGIPFDALQQFLRAELSEQELADRSEIFLENSRMQISLAAQKAVENIDLAESTTWKEVVVDVLGYEYEEDESGEYWIITGEVINRGNWIAKEIEVTAKGYRSYGSVLRKKSTTIDDFLKPDQTKSFTIKLKHDDVTRFGFEVEWKVVE